MYNSHCIVCVDNKSQLPSMNVGFDYSHVFLSLLGCSISIVFHTMAMS